MWLVGAFEGGSSQGLSLNAFLQWSKQVPAVLASLKSLLAAGTGPTGSAAAAPSLHVSTLHCCIPIMPCSYMQCCVACLHCMSCVVAFIMTLSAMMTIAA